MTQPFRMSRSFFLWKPSWQTHATLAGADRDRLGHGVHPIDPCIGLYVPTPHGRQALEFRGKNDPGGHKSCAGVGVGEGDEDGAGLVVERIPVVVD